LQAKKDSNGKKVSISAGLRRFERVQNLSRAKIKALAKSAKIL
jgi:hypothetical protein